MSTVTANIENNGKSYINFELTYREQIEIENICTEQNKTFSQYFLELHRANYNAYHPTGMETEEQEEEITNEIHTEKSNPKKKINKTKDIDKK